MDLNGRDVAMERIQEKIKEMEARADLLKTQNTTVAREEKEMLIATVHYLSIVHHALSMERPKIRVPDGMVAEMKVDISKEATQLLESLGINSEYSQMMEAMFVSFD